MFKKLVIFLMISHQMKGMLVPLPLFPHVATITINNTYNYSYAYHSNTHLEREVRKNKKDIGRLRSRIGKIERQFSGIFNYYGLLGMSAMLSAITVQHAAGFIKFQHITFPDLIGDLAVIASCGYCMSLGGVASNKAIDTLTKQKSDSKIDWILPTAFGALSFLVSWKPLNKIILNSVHDTKYQIIGSGLFLATTFLSGAIIHYTHQKLYGYSKYRK